MLGSSRGVRRRRWSADAERQAGLADAVRANRVGSTTPHVVVVLPAFSLADSLLSHFATRLGAYEHRYLLSVADAPEDPRVPAGFFHVPRRLSPRSSTTTTGWPRRAGWGGSARAGCTSSRWDDAFPTGPCRPSCSTGLRPWSSCGVSDQRDGSRLIEPWNVTATGSRSPGRSALPLNGADPRLATRLQERRPAGCSTRSVFPRPTASRTSRHRGRGRSRRHASGAPARTSGGSWSSTTTAVPGTATSWSSCVTSRVTASRPADLVGALQGSLPSVVPRPTSGRAAVVEELVAGLTCAAPAPSSTSCPKARHRVLSTHEQILGGENGQVYSGCRFPADPAYAARLAEYAAGGQRLADLGARGRLGVDFVSVRRRAVGRPGDRGEPAQGRHHTSVRGAAPPRAGRLRRRDGGTTRRRTDPVLPLLRRLLDPSWTTSRPAQVIEAVAKAAGVRPRPRTGVVLHMLSCLKVDGRLGVTAIGEIPPRRTAVCRDRETWPRSPDVTQAARPARGRRARGRPPGGRAERSAGVRDHLGAEAGLPRARARSSTARPGRSVAAIARVGTEMR